MRKQILFGALILFFIFSLSAKGKSKFNLMYDIQNLPRENAYLVDLSAYGNLNVSKVSICFNATESDNILIYGNDPITNEWELQSEWSFKGFSDKGKGNKKFKNQNSVNWRYFSICSEKLKIYAYKLSVSKNTLFIEIRDENAHFDTEAIPAINIQGAKVYNIKKYGAEDYLVFESRIFDKVQCTPYYFDEKTFSWIRSYEIATIESVTKRRDNYCKIELNHDDEIDDITYLALDFSPIADYNISMYEKRNDLYIVLNDSEDYYFYKTREGKVRDIFTQEELSKLLPKFTDKKLESFIYDLTITCEYYNHWNYDERKWFSDTDAFIKNISFSIHIFGNGNSDIKNETAKIPFYTTEEKQNAFAIMIADYEAQNEYKDREKENQDTLYLKAVTSKNIEKLVKYIEENSVSKYFHEEVYSDIAKLVAKNSNIELKELPYISNPYGLDKNCLYYARSLPVYQWTGNGSFLAEVGTNKVIFIRNVYDLTKINGGTANAYLKYKGAYEYNSISAGVQVVAEFDLVYSFDFPPEYYWKMER